MKSTKELKPGVKYPGYGFINDYGEFQFQPSEVGSRQGQRKLLKGDADFTVYTTNNLLILHCSIERKLPRMGRIQKMMQIIDKFLNILKDYDI